MVEFIKSRWEHFQECCKHCQGHKGVFILTLLFAGYSFISNISLVVDLPKIPLPKIPLAWAAVVVMCVAFLMTIEGSWRLRAKIISDGKEELQKIEKQLEAERLVPAVIKITPLELHRTISSKGGKTGRHIFMRAKIELVSPLRVEVNSYRMELSRGGVQIEPEFINDISQWEITDWSVDPIPHNEIRSLPSELESGRTCEGWVHFLSYWEDRDLDRSVVRLFVHTSRGTGNAQVTAGHEYWNPIPNRMLVERN